MYPARVSFAEAAAAGRLYTVSKPRWRSDRLKWAVNYRDPVTNRRKQRLFKDERKAWAFYNRVEDDREALRAGSLSVRQVSVGARGLTPLLDLFKLYKTDMEGRRISEPHVRVSKRTLERAAAAAGWQIIRDIDAASVLKWLTQFSAATANGYLRILRAFTSWARKNNFAPDDALEDVSRLRQSPVRPCRAFTPDEFNRLTACPEIRPARRLYYLLAGRTGLRHTELRRLKWEHIDFEHHAIALPGSDQKAGRADLLPVLPPLTEELRKVRQAPAATVFRSSPTRRTFEADLERAKIEKKNERGPLYRRSLRKTLGTHLALAGVDLRTTQNLMRHTDPKLTANLYTEAALLPLREGLAALDAKSATKEETA